MPRAARKNASSSTSLSSSSLAATKANTKNDSAAVNDLKAEISAQVTQNRAQNAQNDSSESEDASDRSAYQQQSSSESGSDISKLNESDEFPLKLAGDGKTLEPDLSAAEAAQTPQRQRNPKRRRKSLPKKEIKLEEEDGFPSQPMKNKPSKKSNIKKEVEAKDGAREEEDEEEKKPERKKRRKTPEEDREYEIAPIEQVLPSDFKGRLGYACLNTILRKRKPPVFCSRTCRIDTIKKEGMDFLKELGRQNVKDLATIIQWNEDNGIKFMRLSSDMFPFASHNEYGYTLEYAAEELKAAGDLAKKYGHRLTTHPGQFTQLGSPRKVVVENAIKDLASHCEMLDRMGMGKDSVMIIHMGGVFGDKAATLDRFRENYARLSDNIKMRLVLENDEICYNVDDLMPVCTELNIPIIFDYHHDWIYPSEKPASELIPVINEMWHRKGIKPKQHYSEPRPGAVSVMERRAHSNRVKILPDHLPADMDLMLECKDKEQACFYLYRLYGLQEVNPRVLRPPAEVESMHTAGRKSSKKKKSKNDDGDEEDGECAECAESDCGEDVKGAEDEEVESDPGLVKGNAKLEEQLADALSPPRKQKKGTAKAKQTPEEKENKRANMKTKKA